jgi:hypothetical protein
MRPLFLETLTVVYHENQPIIQKVPNITFDASVIGGTILLFTVGMIYMVKKYLPKIVRKHV